MTKKFTYNAKLDLENGESIHNFHLRYTTYGALNTQKSNVVWIFHALTANSDAKEWWSGLVGDNKLFTPKKYFIICVNMPGSCYGSISPLHKNKNGDTYYHQFPLFTIKDMVKCYKLLRTHLGISQIEIGVGGSMGGQQLLEWAIEEPSLFKNIIPIATNAKHSPWGIAFNTSQRFAIEADVSWKLKHKKAGETGLKVARGIALLSYRSYETYSMAQSEETNNIISNFKSTSYQKYQGEKLAKRFNAFSYYFLTKSMDSHNVARGRTSVNKALRKIKAKTLIIGIETDILFPIQEQVLLSKTIPKARLAIISSTFGHDGFLLETKKIKKIIFSFLNNKKNA